MSKKKSALWHKWQKIKENFSELCLTLGIPTLFLLVFFCLFYFLREPHVFKTQRIEGICTDVEYYSEDVFYRRYPRKSIIVTVDEEKYIIPECYLLTVIRNEDELDSIIGREVVLEYSKYGRLKYKGLQICALESADGSQVFISLDDALAYSNKDSVPELIVLIFAVVAGIVLVAIPYSFWVPYYFKEMLRKHKRKKRIKEKKKQKELSKKQKNDCD